MQAMTLTGPWQCSHSVMSILNTRFSRRAQVMAARCSIGLRSSVSGSAPAVFDPLPPFPLLAGVTMTRYALFEANAMKPRQVHARPGHQRRQPRHEIQGLENDMRGTVPIRGLQLIADPAVFRQR